MTATPAPARGRADASPARLAPEPADRVAERVDAIPDAPATEPALPPDRRFYGGRGLRHRLIHFTFDDGPRAATTPRLLDHLARHRVRATFFLVTRALDDPRRRDTARATVRRMAAEGHTIGLHGHDHRGFRNLSDRDLREQLRYGGQLIADVTARAPHFVRPPYGGRDARTDRVLARLGLRQVLWSMTPERPRNDGQEAIVSQFRAQLAAREGEPFPGTVVLMHDTRPWVVEAIPRILRHLRRRNCQILREGGQLWDVVPTLEALYGLSDAEVAGRQDALRGELAPRCAAATGDEDDTEP
ncbi:MAG: polysaccharide deacetylase family protein [Sandaracinaceae bacterium]|nr:polysaccharide deacetylase family protein [Sandaracinaceae bacterium]